MFKPSLETHLKNIFGLNRIIFDSFQLGKELEGIFVDIDDVVSYTREQEISFLVLGRLDLCGSIDKLKYGWAHGKIKMADHSETDPFIFGRKETAIKSSFNNNEFVKVSIDFVYRFYKDFNPISAKISSDVSEIKIQEEN